jgi:hypothetical protein
MGTKREEEDYGYEVQVKLTLASVSFFILIKG